MSDRSFSIEPATYEDVPALAKIWNDAFKGDRHREIRDLGRVPFPFQKLAKSQIPRWLKSESYLVFKVVDGGTGDSMGWIAWGFHGFEEDEISIFKGVPLEKDHGDENQKQLEPEQPDEMEESIKKLEQQADQDIKNWEQRLMPPGTKCLSVSALSVSPDYQRRGVGSALLKWGTDLADRNDVFIWLRSLEGAVGMYAKAGFEVIGALDVNLDEFALRPPNDERGKWGHYSFKYMRYLPNKA